MYSFNPVWLRLIAIFVMAGCSTSAGEASAADLVPGKLDLKTERAIVFKDGYALIVKRGEAVTDETGHVYLDDVPDAAVLGSFWVAPDEGRLVNLVAGWKDVKEQAEKELPCLQTIELLLANKGQLAKVELHDKVMLNGVIHEVLVERTEVAAPPAWIAALPQVEREATTQMVESISGNSFILRTDEGDVMLQVAQVRSLSVKNMKTTLARTVTTSRRTKRLTLEFDKPKQRHLVNVMYFRPGLRWIPTYRIELAAEKAKKTANIALQAEILNEAEDLKGVPLDIVVGVPNFRFRETPSPLVLESVLRNALAQSDPNLMGQVSNSLSNAMYTQRSGEFRRGAVAANAAAQEGQVDLPGELTASGAQDLFIYGLPKLTMNKSERAAVSIFTADSPYRDIYTWDVHVARHDIEAAPSGAGVKSPLTLSKNEVWHQIDLTNGTNLPWTTGAAMLMQGQQPLSQELLTYTPPKNDVRVPVTVSVDLRGHLEEKEMGRDLKALTWDGYNYVRIDKEAKLHLCNNKPATVEVEITLRLGGKVVNASDKGDVVLSPFSDTDWVQYRGHPAVNNSSLVSWKIKLEPGETFEPIVHYHYFSRN